MGVVGALVTAIIIFLVLTVVLVAGLMLFTLGMGWYYASVGLLESGEYDDSR